VADTLAEGRALRRSGATVVVIDALPPGREHERSCGHQLAAAADGRYLPAADVSPDVLAALLEGAG
jgi:hypothetical protein